MYVEFNILMVIEDDEWLALVSGIEVGAPDPSDAQTQMLVEYLTGEAGGSSDQASSASISRLIVTGNSLAPVVSINAVNSSETDRKSVRIRDVVFYESSLTYINIRSLAETRTRSCEFFFTPHRDAFEIPP